VQAEYPSSGVDLHDRYSIEQLPMIGLVTGSVMLADRLRQARGGGGSLMEACHCLKKFLPGRCR
jgi:hypothetical protein